MANILVVDDDPAILTMIQKILSKDGHQITVVAEPDQIYRMKLEIFDLILLDVMMPKVDGYTLCREIRDVVDCPILFLTAKTQENDLIQGLENGGDDYIGKPFGTRELRARVAAHLRRERREHTVRLSFANAYFNLSASQLVVDGMTIPFTKSEYQICEFLARNALCVFEGADL